MKTCMVLCYLVAASLAAPAERAMNTDAAALRALPALRHEEVHDEFGQYAFRYITAQNTVVSERGYLIPGKEGGYVMVIEGQYQYVGDDGQIYVTKYIGGPDGFHVLGDHLPQPVPVPAVA